MTHCLDKYYAIMFDKSGLVNTNSDIWLQQYYELVNEQMFYFQVKYLPMDVIIEWMDGILDNVIIRKFRNGPEAINKRAELESIKNSAKQDIFPRLKSAFTIKSGIDYTPAFDKEKTQNMLKPESGLSLRC